MKNILLALLLFVQINGFVHGTLESPIYPKITAASKKKRQADMGQAHLIKQITRYLTLQDRDKTFRVSFQDGLCNGFAFLAQYYTDSGKEEEFFQALQLISLWDGSRQSLKEAPGIDPYHTLEELFEQWVNDLIWLQHVYVRLEGQAKFSHPQRHRAEQFESIKKPKEERRIAMLLNPIHLNEVSLEQLEELLVIWSAFPGTIIEIAGGRHATSARVLENGTFFYYDPNLIERQPIIDSPKKLARLIQKTKYRALGIRYKLMEIELMAYQYLRPGETPKLPKLDAKKWKTDKNSPNRFTPFHTAILARDLAALRSHLNAKQGNPNAADSHGLTPLNLATHMGNCEAIKELLKDPRVDINKPQGQGDLTPIMAAVQSLDSEATLLLLTHGANLFHTPKEHYEFADIEVGIDAGSINSLKLLSLPILHIGIMNTSVELSYMRELCRKFPEILNLQDTRGNSLLHYAAALKNRELMETLLSEGAKSDQLNGSGKTVERLFEAGSFSK